jgi:hypothetical protein
VFFSSEAGILIAPSITRPGARSQAHGHSPSPRKNTQNAENSLRPLRSLWLNSFDRKMSGQKNADEEMKTGERNLGAGDEPHAHQPPLNVSAFVRRNPGAARYP